VNDLAQVGESANHRVLQMLHRRLVAAAAGLEKGQGEVRGGVRCEDRDLRAESGLCPVRITRFEQLSTLFTEGDKTIDLLRRQIRHELFVREEVVALRNQLIDVVATPTGSAQARRAASGRASPAVQVEDRQRGNQHEAQTGTR
jgi:hypothetical protein